MVKWNLIGHRNLEKLQYLMKKSDYDPMKFKRSGIGPLWTTNVSTVYQGQDKVWNIGIYNDNIKIDKFKNKITSICCHWIEKIYSYFRGKNT